ncbi:unnamed protein product, partial [Brenthis ino]
MDPSMYLQYSPPNGLPQESKLATYMNRSASTPNRSLNQAMSKLSMESSPTSAKKTLIPHPQQPPNIFTPAQPQIMVPTQPQIFSPNPPQAMFSPSQPQTIFPAQPQAMYNPAQHQAALYSPNHQQALYSPNQQAIFGPPNQQVVIGEFIPINYYNPAMLPESPESSPPNTLPLQVNTQVHQENVGGTTYFYPTTSETLNASVGLNTSAAMGGGECIGVSAYATQMYAPAHMPPVHKAQPDQEYQQTGLAASFYMPETIRAEIYNKDDQPHLNQQATNYQGEIPDTVEIYGELMPLEQSGPHALASSFRVTHRTTGEYFALRRLHGCGAPPAANKRMDVWRNVDHPNVVRLHRVFSTKEFGDHSLVMAYDYHPVSTTLMSKYLHGAAPGSGPDANGAFHDPFPDPGVPRPYTHQKNAMLRAFACGALLPEAVLWSMIVQLTAGLRAIHTHGLACRTLEPTKVIMSGCRVRIAWCGIADAVQHNSVDIAQAQQEDLTALGRLALALACRSVHCENLPACMDLITRTYSPDLKNVILYLLSTTATRRSVTDLMPMIGARFYTQVEALQRRADAFEEQLTREIDNGRLLRILVKLGVVNERPELNNDPTWSETGDRYMLKLFRDYIFHSVTGDGRPWIDQAHVANALNHLDCGSAIKVELMSRDEQSVLVVSYAELKHCLDGAFAEVMIAAGADRENLSFSSA